MLSEKEKLESCEAVRQFLIDGEKFTNGGNIPCLFIQGTQRSEKQMRIEFINHIPSYNIDDDVFKSYGLRNPIWSAYKLLKWDSIDRELIIEIPDQRTEIRLKRI